MTSKATTTVSIGLFTLMAVGFTSGQVFADQYNVTGRWNAVQSNGATAVFDVDSQRPDGNIDGRAHYNSVRGTGAGRVRGNRFTFTVEWNNNTIGVYNGTFDSVGNLSGLSFEAGNPRNQATWVASRQFSRF